MSDAIIRIITVSGKGQISIPREIRRRLDIEKGSNLLLMLKDEKILICKAPELLGPIEDTFEDVIRYSEASLQKIWNNEHDDVWNAYLKT